MSERKRQRVSARREACRDFSRGHCPRGEDCRYVHGKRDHPDRNQGSSRDSGSSSSSHQRGRSPSHAHGDRDYGSQSQLYVQRKRDHPDRTRGSSRDRENDFTDSRRHAHGYRDYDSSSLSQPHDWHSPPHAHGYRDSDSSSSPLMSQPYPAIWTPELMPAKSGGHQKTPVPELPKQIQVRPTTQTRTRSSISNGSQKTYVPQPRHIDSPIVAEAFPFLSGECRGFEIFRQERRLRPIYSPLAWEFAKNVNNKTPPTLSIENELTQLAELLEADAESNYSQSIRGNESTWTGFFAALLSRELSRWDNARKYVAVNQIAMTDLETFGRTGKLDRRFSGKTDTALNRLAPFDHRRGRVPMVFEWKVDGFGDCENQLARYCSCLSNLGLPSHFLTCQINVNGAAFQVIVQLMVAANVPKHQGTVTNDSEAELRFISMKLCSFSGSMQTVFSRLIHAVCQTLETIETDQTYELEPHIDVLQHLYFSGDRSKTKTIARFNNKAIKVYCPRPESHSSRRPTLYKIGIPSSVIQVETRTLQVLTYDWIEGEVHPTDLKVSHFWLAARELQGLYTRGLIAHGDIRLANLIFGKDTLGQDTATWIDFDFSVGKNEQRVYPANWNKELDDAERHTTAEPGRQILQEHDIFSFGKLLSFYQPVDPELRQLWTSLSNSLAALSNFADYEVEFEKVIPPEGQEGQAKRLTLETPLKLSKKIARSR